MLLTILRYTNARFEGTKGLGNTETNNISAGGILGVGILRADAPKKNKFYYETFTLGSNAPVLTT